MAGGASVQNRAAELVPDGVARVGPLGRVEREVAARKVSRGRERDVDCEGARVAVRGVTVALAAVPDAESALQPELGVIRADGT